MRLATHHPTHSRKKKYSKKHSRGRIRKTKTKRRQRPKPAAAAAFARTRIYTCRVCCKWVRKQHKQQQHSIKRKRHARARRALPRPISSSPFPFSLFSQRGGAGSNSNITITRADTVNQLKHTCPNPEYCIDVGNNEAPIEAFFGHFRNLQMVTPGKIRRIGANSKNGFVLKLPFEEDNYTAWTVLKCVRHPEYDNLALEAWSGLYFVNRFVKTYPCFVKTYGLWKINDLKSYRKLSHVSNINAASLTALPATPLSEMLTYLANVPPPAQMCRDAQFFAVMIQHFGRFQSLGDAFHQAGVGVGVGVGSSSSSSSSSGIQQAEIVCVLFQIYFALVQLQLQFTHYDLHWSNVGLYQPFADPNDYVEMHYHLNNEEEGEPDREIVFPCPVIAKILDYGRAYVDISDTQNTGTLHDAICNEPQCEPDCGAKFGFDTFSADQNAKNHITPNRPNPSADLRLAWIINQQHNKKFEAPFFHPDVHIQYHTQFGTPANVDDGYDVANHRYDIANINDMYNHLLDILQATPGAPMPSFLSIQQHSSSRTYPLADLLSLKYTARTKRATMHVYSNGQRPYTFQMLETNVQKQSSHPTISPEKQEALFRPALVNAEADVATLVDSSRHSSSPNLFAPSLPLPSARPSQIRKRLFAMEEEGDENAFLPNAKR